MPMQLGILGWFGDLAAMLKSVSILMILKTVGQYLGAKRAEAMGAGIFIDGGPNRSRISAVSHNAALRSRCSIRRGLFQALSEPHLDNRLPGNADVFAPATLDSLWIGPERR